MIETDNLPDLVFRKNICLAYGKLIKLMPDERLDKALQSALPFSRSEIQDFIKEPCLALVTNFELAAELTDYIEAASSNMQANCYMLSSEIRAKQANFISKYKDKLQFKAYKPSFKVKQETYIFCLPQANLAVLYQAEPEKIPLNIVYEDDYLLVIDKQKGLVVHPAAGNWQGTLLNGLLYYLKNTQPYLVHRIDKDTSGLLVVAKTLEVQQILQKELQKHAIQRTYQALAWGHISEEKFTIKGAIARDPANPLRKTIQVQGKSAITHARLLEQFSNFAYLELQLETGRTHQIRVHLAALNHPLLGDTLYGGERIKEQTETGQCLHAVKLSFKHPVTKEFLQFTSPLPAYFENLLDLARQGII